MAPTVSATTTRWWNHIAEYQRDRDAIQPGDFPLMRFLSLLGEELHLVTDFLTRSDPTDTGVSALLDPATADAAWLPWLAQLVGVDLSSIASVPDRRAAIAGASSGWRAGTEAGIAAIVAAQLTGTKKVTITRPGPFQILIVTYASQTPFPGAIIPAIIAAKANPAGVLITATTVTGQPYALVNNGRTYGDITTEYATYADLLADI
jgi:hypothetical protein